MSTPNDGGPAWPSAPVPNATDERSDQRDGMSLRDWFAGQALVQFGEPEAMRFWMSAGTNDYAKAYALIADDCYLMADAMINARKKQLP